MERGDSNHSTLAALKVNALLTPEILNNSEGYAKGPVRSLMSALLFDGVQSFLDHVFLPKNCKTLKSSEAYNWVMKRGNEYIFAFDSVCEALGVDPDYLRIGLINLCNAQIGSRKRSRRNF